MSGSIKIWISAAFNPVYRCGGWAYVRTAQGQLTGAAGGERNTTASRTALAGLAGALRDPPPAAAIEVQTTSPELAQFAHIFTRLGAPTQADGPEQDLDLWAQILAASAGRSLSLLHKPITTGTPLAFATAWAELARDKAKATGAFSAAIPKTNLAKVLGLASI